MTDPVRSRRARAVVFAYHNVGVHCLYSLLAHDVEVALVVTHPDDPNENQWFASVGELVEHDHGLFRQTQLGETLKPVMDEIAANETGAACDEDHVNPT